MDTPTPEVEEPTEEHPRALKPVGASYVAALFGVSPWETEWTLWHKWRGHEFPKRSDDERMSSGRLLEPVIIDQVRQQLGLIVEPNTEQRWVTHPKYPVGCIVDAWVHCPTRGLGVVECKAHDYLWWRQNYAFDEAGQCTAAAEHEEIQLAAEMLAIGARWGLIACAVGGNVAEPLLIERRPDAELEGAIIRRTRDFLVSVDRGIEPSVTGTAAELRGLSDLYPPEQELQEALDLRGTDLGAELATLAESYLEAQTSRKRAEASERSAKVALLNAARDHNQMWLDGMVVYVRRTRTASKEYVTSDIAHALRLAAKRYKDGSEGWRRCMKLAKSFITTRGGHVRTSLTIKPEDSSNG